MLRLMHVYKSYVDSDKQLNKTWIERIFSEKAKKKVISDLNLEIHQGEIVGYIGENGAGKSTTIKMILGIIPADSGEVTVFGRKSFNNRRKNAKDIGVLFGQKSHLWWDLPLIDSFNFLQKIYSKTSKQDMEWLKWLMSELEVDDYVDQPVRELSLGQRMRGEFICALIHSPKLVILDEPTIGIDVQTKKKMMEMILKINEQKNTTFMITSHDFQEIEKVSQKIIILDKGENAYQGSIEDFKNQYSFLKKIMFEHEQGKAIKVTHPNIKELARNITSTEFFFDTRNLSEEHAIAFFKKEYSSNNVEVSNLSLSELMTVKKVLK
ncbi:MAG: ATP-binding cassette domain-containing protein [Streptococcus sp.]|jgi:ABC transporter, ATP-binding protein|nr:ATP-binding cassette domain-containing protein [Streptococcus sp.]